MNGGRTKMDDKKDGSRVRNTGCTDCKWYNIERDSLGAKYLCHHPKNVIETVCCKSGTVVREINWMAGERNKSYTCPYFEKIGYNRKVLNSLLNDMTPKNLFEEDKKMSEKKEYDMSEDPRLTTPPHVERAIKYNEVAEENRKLRKDGLKLAISFLKFYNGLEDADKAVDDICDYLTILSNGYGS